MKYNYQYPERLARIPKPDLDAANGNIVIYGTEVTGALTANALKQCNISFLCFADTDIRKHGKTYYEHDIISPQELAERYPDALILIASCRYKAIEATLISLKFLHENIFPVSHVIEGIDLENLDIPFGIIYLKRAILRYNTNCYIIFNKNTKILVYYTIILTSRCTLKCKNCSYLFPYIKSKKDYPIEQILDSINKIINLGYQIDNISLIGGETLLYKELPELIDKLCCYKDINGITITTNGTLSFSSELINIILQNKEKVDVWISDYGTLSPKAEEIKNIMEINCIQYEYARGDKWIKFNLPEIIEPSEQKVINKYKKCERCAKTCYRLLNMGDRIYPCNYNYKYENTMIDKIEKFDSVSIYDNNFERIIESYFLGEKYFEACRYCDTHSKSNMIYIPVAEQLP